MTDALSGRRVGFVGAGAMAEALAGGLVRSGLPAADLRAADPDPARRERFAAAVAARVSADNADVVRESDAVVLAVKPDVVDAALAALAVDASLDRARPLWISIAAGIPLAALEARLPGGTRVVRAMPNTPALVGAGATAVCGNARVGDDDRALARALFDGVGSTWEAPDEALLDAVTGLSGSGPAYVFAFLEALVEAGCREGLPRSAASALAAQTLYGAALLVRETGRSPADLRAQVSSPGGTTLAGLERLEALGLRDAVAAAVAAAAARSRELGGR